MRLAIRVWRELTGVAWASLTARKGRAVLMTIGPLLGVAAIVGALGLSTSAKAQVRATLAELGTEVVVVSAAGGGDDARLPAAAAERAESLSGVVDAAGLTALNAVTVSRTAGAADTLDTRAVTVLATEPALRDVAGIELASGRFLDAYDQRAGSLAAVLGAGAAERLGVLPGEVRTILLNEQSYAVVGVLRPAPLLRELDDAVLVTPAAANQFQPDPAPSGLVVRTRDGAAPEVARQLGVAVTYGHGGLPEVRVPSSLLAARAEIDRTLQLVIIAMGGLVVAIGGLGIANVMTISVLQRSTEIGLRRALGHRRAIIAGQFLIEAALVGTLGAVGGLALGVGFVVVAAAGNGWVVAVDPVTAVGTVALSIAVALVAGGYPASRAARLAPAAALRTT